MHLKPLLEKLYPLHRTLASDGTDEALKIVGEHMPAGSNYKIETYIPGTSVWTWSVPERFVVYEAYLETESGERVVDFAENLLHIVSYSLPIDAILTWEELEPHLYYNEKRPWATDYQLAPRLSHGCCLEIHPQAGSGRACRRLTFPFFPPHCPCGVRYMGGLSDIYGAGLHNDKESSEVPAAERFPAFRSSASASVVTA